MLETLLFNLRYASRQLFRNRGFAVTVVLIMAFGIGLNTAMFSIIRGVLLRPLGYHEPDRLVVLSESATPIRYEEIAASAKLYDGLGAYLGGSEDLAFSGNGQPEILKGSRVSGNFLNVLGVHPLLGRGFYPAEDTHGAPAVAMISTRLWQRRFNNAPSIVGQPITLAGRAYTIIGVLPDKFAFPHPDSDVWLPRPSEWSAMAPESQRISPILQVFGRLKPGVTLQQADAELMVMNRQYSLAHPGMLDANQGLSRSWGRTPITSNI